MPKALVEHSVALLLAVYKESRFQLERKAARSREFRKAVEWGMGRGLGRLFGALYQKAIEKAAAWLPLQRLESPKSNQRKILNVPRRDSLRE